ncbi:MAG: response regulator [Pseudomonadota bacterium]
MTAKPLILIIDDDIIVQKILLSLLKQGGCEAIQAYRADEGLKLAEEKNPELILLDIMMPEMTGFEAIARLKKNEKTREIPVIFLSAKVEPADRVRGLELGAADFVNKPFDRAELQARIKTQIQLKRQEEALKEYSQNLEKMVEERTRQLLHADRLASLGTLSAGIAHEINNPTTFITGNLQTFEQFWKVAVNFLEKVPEAQEDKKLQYVIKEFPAMIKSIRHGADRITDIVSGLKTFARKDSAEKKQTDIGQCLDEALNLTNNRLKYYVQVEKSIEPDLPKVWANAQQLVQVFVNLLLNTADAVGEREGRLKITVRSLGSGKVRIAFSDDGQGIPHDIKGKIFDPFFTTKPLGQGTGLGLSITHGIIQDHLGTIEVESEPGQGSTFTITLPTEKV